MRPKTNRWRLNACGVQPPPDRHGSPAACEIRLDIRFLEADCATARPDPVAGNAFLRHQLVDQADRHAQPFRHVGNSQLLARLPHSCFCTP